MVGIKAFSGVTFQNYDLQKVIVPPYDVIDSELKNKLMQKSEFSFVNLILNTPDESARLLKKWIQEGVLKKDSSDAIYIYQQEYLLDNKIVKRTGFICLLKVEEFGKNVLPHEKTFQKHIDNRYELTVKTNANLGQIFMVYEDKKKEIDSISIPLTNSKEEMLFVDSDNCKHKIWRITNTETIQKIVNLMKNKQVLIADGHHRYSTAIKFSKENSFIKNSDFTMVTLVNSLDDGLVILPTNRILSNKVIDLDLFSNYFNITEVNSFDELFEKLFEKKSCFGVGVNNKKFFLELKDKEILNELFSNGDEVYKLIDAAILHKLIFEKILGIQVEDQVSPNLEFVKGNETTIKSLNENNTGFFVRPPTMQETRLVALAGKVMPQKSTYFFPKMYSGFVINKFEEEGKQ